MQFIARQLMVTCVLTGSMIESSYVIERCFFTDHVCPNRYVSFWLYSRETEYDPIWLDVFNIPNDVFRIKKPMVVLIHGFTGDRDHSPNSHIRPVLLQTMDVFVLSLDYNPLARSPCYLHATYNIKTVANCTALLLDQLIIKGFLDIEDLHIVGFSLGGQLAGMIANFFSSGKLKRITGLDPAGPLFVFARNENRLDSSDAEFVDVIHTNAGKRGALFQVGHLDFYPNGGCHQPGCMSHIFLLEAPGDCSHDRAPIYYAESITSKIGFWGYACYNWLHYISGFCKWTSEREQALMGYHASPSARGTYFMETNKLSPYARGPYPHPDYEVERILSHTL